MQTIRTVPMQVRVRPSFYSSIKEAAERLNISACAFVRLSVATQIKREKDKVLDSTRLKTTTITGEAL